MKKRHGSQSSKGEPIVPQGQNDSESLKIMARQIAVLIVRQHRRRLPEEGKKSGKNAL